MESRHRAGWKDGERFKASAASLSLWKREIVGCLVTGWHGQSMLLVEGAGTRR